MEIDHLPRRSQIKKTESPIEDILLREFHMVGLYPTLQYTIGKYRADFAFIDTHLIVECDGKEYHSTPEQIEYDQNRQAYLEQQGWKVIRFSGSDIYQFAEELANMTVGRKTRFDYPHLLPLIELDEMMNTDEWRETRERNTFIQEENEAIIHHRSHGYSLQAVVDIIKERYGESI